MDQPPSDQEIRKAVRKSYGNVARRLASTADATTGCCGSQGVAGCCGPMPSDVAQGVAAGLYSVEELSGLPGGVKESSLGCGNPTAIAELQPGEVVLDLGSGSGIDCFLAAQKVGPRGRVIGLDMTPEMVELARRNAVRMRVANVSFQRGEMEEVPLPDASVDVIISNCVINLSPDKEAVFREAYRVLRPGGRMSISDTVVSRELPAGVREDLAAWSGCLAGALPETVYLDLVRAAGFARLEVISRDFIPLSQAGGWARARQVLVEAGLSPSELDRVAASLCLTAFKPQ